jgi:hypothetical protein
MAQTHYIRGSRSPGFLQFSIPTVGDPSALSVGFSYLASRPPPGFPSPHNTPPGVGRCNHTCNHPTGSPRQAERTSIRPTKAFGDDVIVEPAGVLALLGGTRQLLGTGSGEHTSSGFAEESGVVAAALRRSKERAYVTSDGTPWMVFRRQSASVALLGLDRLYRVNC